MSYKDAIREEEKKMRRLDRAALRWIAAAEELNGIEYELEGLKIQVEKILRERRGGLDRPRGRSKISASKKVRILLRDGNKCVSCGETENLCMDHIHPISKGGTNDESNLQTLCRSCNSRKGAKVLTEQPPNPDAQ